MTTALGGHTTSARTLNNYTIELLRKYPDLRVLQRCTVDGRSFFCILCVAHNSQDNRITYRGVTYTTDSNNSLYPEQSYTASTVYDTLTTNNYYWKLDSVQCITYLESCQVVYTIEEALPILEQEIMVGEL